MLAVVRHGDRTPKQKMKMKVTQEPLLRLLATHLDAKGKQAKLKSPSELQVVLMLATCQETGCIFWVSAVPSPGTCRC